MEMKLQNHKAIILYTLYAILIIYGVITVMPINFQLPDVLIMIFSHPAAKISSLLLIIIVAQYVDVMLAVILCILYVHIEYDIYLARKYEIETK
jgi:hypothetical protein